MSEIIIKTGNSKIVQTPDKIVITVEDDKFIDLSKSEAIQYEDSDIQYNETPLLSITIQDLKSVPVVLYEGKKVEHKVSINYNWQTIEADCDGQHSFSIEHLEREMEKRLIKRSRTNPSRY